MLGSPAVQNGWSSSERTLGKVNDKNSYATNKEILNK
jgi:hypothetical protein